MANGIPYFSHVMFLLDIVLSWFIHKFTRVSVKTAILFKFAVFLQKKNKKHSFCNTGPQSYVTRIQAYTIVFAAIPACRAQAP